MEEQTPESFVQTGPAQPLFPVIVAVPHAGRDYPPALLAASRLGRAQLELLEDRHADSLASDCAKAGFTVLVARRARAWIDLNRDEREIDPEMIEPRPRRESFIRSARVGGGLGLLPRRLRGCGDILRNRVAQADLDRRIAEDFRPYHARLGALLAAARQRHGIAVLLDLHSMPPLHANGEAVSRIVIGDRFGASAADRFTATLRETAIAAGYAVGENSPYAGGHVLTAHGRPARGIHALQLEIDRSLYLDASLRNPLPALGGMGRFVLGCARALADEALGASAAIAAE